MIDFRQSRRLGSHCRLAQRLPAADVHEKYLQKFVGEVKAALPLEGALRRATGCFIQPASV
jgi:hypothetical protein